MTGQMAPRKLPAKLMDRIGIPSATLLQKNYSSPARHGGL